MISRSALAVSALVLQATAAVAAGCQADAKSSWQAGEGHHFTIEALASGPNCETAVLLLVVRDDKSTPIYTFAAPASQVAPFVWQPAKTAGAMKATLGAWISPSDAVRNMSELPTWKQGAEQPATDPPQEFPFMASSELSRDDYENWRARKLSMFCFVTGMESQTCLANPEGNSIRELGLQLFPG